MFEAIARFCAAPRKGALRRQTLTQLVVCIGLAVAALAPATATQVWARSSAATTTFQSATADQSARAAHIDAQTIQILLALTLVALGFIGVPALILVLRSRERSGSEHEQRMQNARFAATVESIPSGIVMLDRDDKLVACNQLYRRMYDLPDHLCVPGTPLEHIVRHGVTLGLLKDEVAKSGSYRVRLEGKEKISKRTWELLDGRIIALSASAMSDGGRVSIHNDITDQHRAAERIAESEARFRDYAASAADWCWETNADHCYVFLMGAFWSSRGIDTRLVIGMNLENTPVHPEDAGNLQQILDAMQKQLPFRGLRVRLQLPRNTYISIAANGCPRFASDGTFLGYRGTARDITREQADIARLKATERELRRRTQLLEEAQHLGKLGNVNHIFGTQHSEWSAEIYHMMRVPPELGAMPNGYIRERCLFDGMARLDAALQLITDSTSTQSLDVKVRRYDGTIIDCALSIKGLFNENNEHIGFRSVVQDISERKRSVEQLEQLAFYDQLTGLPNRAYFKRELDELLAGDGWADAALLLLDLDRFKDVNDSLGHASGDELLSKVSAIIGSRLEREHLLTRIGGDEFAIIMKCTSGQSEAKALAESIIDAVSGTILLSNGEVAVGTSIGIAFPSAETTAPNLLRQADLALYKAKEGGRGRVAFFREDMDAELQHKMRLERDLKRALHEEFGLSVSYQPQVDLRDGAVTGFEALMRWTHTDLGSVSPAVFIPIAERSSLIVDLGRWILRRAATQMKAWMDAGHEPREISVNVSAAQLWHSDLVADVAQILAETGLPARFLCLELTESLLADPSEQRVRGEIGRLKDLGVKLALDDFGTDYSSLGYLTQLPCDKLKIDRIFIDGVATSDRKRELLKGIVALGHGLGMTVIGEGAERPEEIEILALLGCDEAQGYVISRPVPPEEALVAAENFCLSRRPNAVHALQQQLQIAAC